MRLRRGGAGLLVVLGVLAALFILGCSTQTAGSPTAAAPQGSFLPSPPPSVGRTDVLTTGDASFSSPTGNIGCIVFDTQDIAEARCDILQKRWEPPPQPADCEFDWGFGATVGDTAALVCGSDTTLGAARQLAYGDALQVGRFLCTSRETGMTCENTQTRHGFELSQAAYRLF